MSKMYKSDYVDSNGVVYPTIGENIRKGAKENIELVTANSLVKATKEQHDKVKVNESLSVDGNTLKKAIKDALLGKTIHFGAIDVDALSDLELKSIWDNLSMKSGAQ